MKKATKNIVSNSEETKKKHREKMQELLEMHAISMANRVQGTKKHDKGNVGMKQTPCEVFVFLVIADEQLRNSYQEKFKNTRNFKKTVAFETVEQLRQYLTEYKFPKTSIFLTIIDHFFENADKNEQQKAIVSIQNLNKQDPSMELIVLMNGVEVSGSKINTNFGTISAIKKTDVDCFKQILNTMIVAVHERDKIRKQYDTKQILKKATIVAGILLVLMLVIDYVTGITSETKNGLIGVLPRTLFE